MSVLDAIGNTPLVELTRINPNPRVRLLAKLEGANPGGSVKDRIALEMIVDAINRELLAPGHVILEATSGNTGIGLAMVGAALDRRVKLTMPSCPRVQIVAVEPTIGHKIQGLKNMQESIVPTIYDPGRLDRKITVGDDDAFAMTRQLAVREGLFVGMSSGAAAWAAVELAREMTSGTLVVLFPDRGDRYLSMNLFTSVCAQCPP